MQRSASELDTLIHQYLPGLQALPVEQLRYKPAPTRWSKKEILGHTIDSAQNNLRRFITAQYDNTPHIVYNQDQWVALSGYQQYDEAELVQLWYLLHQHLVTVLKNMPPEMALRQCRTESLHTLEWLAQDYIRHLQHHLHQVLGLEPVPYP